MAIADTRDDGSAPMASAAGRGIAIRWLFSPLVFLAVVFGIYGLSFIPSPLGWWNAVRIDTRYLDVYVVFAACFVAGTVLARRAGFAPAPDVPAGLGVQGRQRFIVALAFSLIFLVALTLRNGGFALLAEESAIFRRDFGSSLGGFVVYPTFLLSALAVVAVCQFAVTKRPVWLFAWGAIVLLQVLQFNRQELLICCVAPLMVTFFQSRASLLRMSLFAAAALVAIYVLGSLAVLRYGGAEFISRNVPAHELPFWVFVGDLTGTVRLGHHVADSVGAGGIGGWYVWGVFASIVLPDVPMHGAMAIRDAFTSAQTAQSIPVPLSYYADTGIAGVAVLGLVQGALLQFLWLKAARGAMFSRVVYVLGFLAMLWTVRSGTILFSPIMLFQLAALSFIFGPQVEWRGWSRLTLRVAAALFLVSIPVCLVALAVRF